MAYAIYLLLSIYHFSYVQEIYPYVRPTDADWLILCDIYDYDFDIDVSIFTLKLLPHIDENHKVNKNLSSRIKTFRFQNVLTSIVNSTYIHRYQ